jgi:hypothetical protein
VSNPAPEKAVTMTDFVIRRNIHRFEKLLVFETNVTRRAMIIELIAEEASKLADTGKA